MCSRKLSSKCYLAIVIAIEEACWVEYSDTHICCGCGADKDPASPQFGHSSDCPIKAVMDKYSVEIK